jgi:hypothetical protein
MEILTVKMILSLKVTAMTKGYLTHYLTAKVTTKGYLTHYSMAKVKKKPRMMGRCWPMWTGMKRLKLKERMKSKILGLV